MASGVEVAIGVEVNIDVAVGPDNCPGAQLDRAKLKSKTSIIAVRCFVFIFSPMLSRARLTFFTRKVRGFSCQLWFIQPLTV